MATLKRYGWNKRTALVIMLLLVFASLSVGPVGPAKAFASPCCSWNIITNYYSDETHSTLVGRCVDSDCTGSSCTGQQTEFSSTFVTCCAHCGGV
jgi:hypothetical protein